MTEQDSPLAPEIVARKRVYVVDDDSMVRRSLFFALNTAGFEVRPFASGQDFLDQADELAAGCVLLDLRMPELDGIEVLDALGDRIRRLPVMIITGHGEVEIAVQAMKRGASDFLQKPFTDGALVEVLNSVFEGLPGQQDDDARRVDAAQKVASLTPREREVLQGLLDGLSNKGIAIRFNISARTVEVHRANLMDRLGARSVAEVIRLAIFAGMQPS